MLNILLSIIYAFLFGLTSKIADFHDEHGLKSFKYADIYFGFLWGITMFLSTLLYPKILELHLSILFLAILQLKIDYLNHAIGTIIFLIGAFYLVSLYSINIALLIFILLVYIITDKTTRAFKKLLNPNRFLNFRFYFPSLVYSLIISDFIPFLIILFEIFGVFTAEKIIKI